MNWLSKAFSENDSPSSKRLVGGVGMFIIHAGFVYCAISDGGNMTGNTSDLGELLACLDGGLLGVTTIANAFSGSRSQKAEEKESK